MRSEADIERIERNKTKRAELRDEMLAIMKLNPAKAWTTAELAAEVQRNVQLVADVVNDYRNYFRVTDDDWHKDRKPGCHRIHVRRMMIEPHPHLVRYWA